MCGLRSVTEKEVAWRCQSTINIQHNALSAQNKNASSAAPAACLFASQIQGMRAQGSRSDPCQKCSRITLGLLNLGFFAVGCLFIATGSIVKTNFQTDIFNLNTTRINPKDAQDLRDLATLAPIVLIVIGCFVSILSLLGCIGSCFEKRYLLIVYCMFITLVIAGEIAIGGYAVAKKEGFGQLGADLVNSGFKEPGSRPLFDLICRRRGLSSNSDAALTCDSALNATQLQCATCVQQVLNDNTRLVGISLIVIGCVEIVALVLACRAMPRHSSNPFVRVEVAGPNQPAYVAQQNVSSRPNAQRMPL